ncbi:hypothetical protein V3C99_011857 [Haemonchus contortus]
MLPTTSAEASTDEEPSNLAWESGRHRNRNPGNTPKSRHMDCLFVCSYNCRTIASEASLWMLLRSSRLVKYDVIALQETKGRTETIRKTDHKELLIIGPKANGNVGGVGFLINSTIAHLVDSHNIVSPRLAVLRLRTSDRVAISVINAYAPTSVAAQEEREEFYRLLEKTIQEEKSYYKYVVGDFNAVVGTNCSGDWRLGPCGSGDRTENGELLLNPLYACRLFHGNSMFEKPANRRWTWESPNGRTHTEIDHRDTHRPAHFKTPSFDTELLESAIKAHDWCLLDDPTEDYEHLTKGLLKCADISRRPHLARIPRLSALAVGKQKQSLREYRRTKLLKAAEARSSIRRCKRDLNDQKAVMSALLDKDGSVKTSRSSMENIVQDFYTELFRSSTFVPKCSMPPYEETPAILDSEVANAIRSMKKGTAPGLDNIPADLLRSGSTALHTLLAEHFNQYLRLKRIPQQWKESKTILLFKKGQREDISNYRPISLLSVVYKSFTKALLNRVERILDEYQPVEQTGFRKNFSCMDNIHAREVCQLIERSREYRLPLALLFVDYKKAFDSVEINAVLNALVQAGVDPAYVHLLTQCLSNTSTFIQLFERKLKIPVGKGVRQGDTISPKLFTAALQYAMLNLDWEERGYPVNGKKSQ